MYNKTQKRNAVSRKAKSDPELEKNDTPGEIAYYYGFKHVEDIRIEKDDRDMTKSCLELDDLNEITGSSGIAICPEEKVALLRDFLLENPRGDIPPSMLYYKNATGTSRKYTPDKNKFFLDIIGTTKSIAEAVLIKTIVEILKEEGHANLFVELNSTGDRESSLGFMRDVVNYYKKNLDSLPTHCKQTFKNDPFDLLMCSDEKCKILREDAPNPISSLSENSRIHFGEILEYLEALQIPYKINNNLLHSRKLCSGTIFEIKDALSNTSLALGIRYNGLSKKIGFKKELGAVGAFVNYKGEKSLLRRSETHKVKLPKIYFIQLGFEAKLKSLEIVETLRKNNIALAQELVRDRLTPQLIIAEKSKMPYSLIMGQKEAVENSIIVRNMATCSQETIPIDMLVNYLKKIKMY